MSNDVLHLKGIVQVKVLISFITLLPQAIKNSPQSLGVGLAELVKVIFQRGDNVGLLLSERLHLDSEIAKLLHHHLKVSGLVGADLVGDERIVF